MYDCGRGVERDSKRAEMLYNQAIRRFGASSLRSSTNKFIKKQRDTMEKAIWIHKEPKDFNPKNIDPLLPPRKGRTPQIYDFGKKKKPGTPGGTPGSPLSGTASPPMSPTNADGAAAEAPLSAEEAPLSP